MRPFNNFRIFECARQAGWCTAVKKCARNHPYEMVMDPASRLNAQCTGGAVGGLKWTRYRLRF